MPTNHPAPLLQVRVIATPEHARTLSHTLRHHACAMLGTAAAIRVQTRTARRTVVTSPCSYVKRRRVGLGRRRRIGGV
jgi:hypothetical protein